VAKWTVGKLAANKTPQLNGTIMLIPNSEKAMEEAPPIQMHWKVPMASVSGTMVAFSLSVHFSVC
jgi:AP-3 complex subunit mu